MGEIFIPQIFLSRVNDYIEPTAIFTAYTCIMNIGENYSAKYFCNARVTGMGKMFVPQIFSATQYMMSCPI